MSEIERKTVTEEYFTFLKQKDFPCIAAKAALTKQHIKCLIADHIGCPKNDRAIVKFMYDFIDHYRSSKNFYHSAAIIFKEPSFTTEEIFDKLLWQRLQALADIDADKYAYDKRVNADPSSPDFSFSLKEEAFYIIGLHPASSRAARQFKYPTMVFNPHAQFQQLKQTVKYEVMKKIVRKRDIKFSGSVNPMLRDYGELSEALQYSGQQYQSTWKCPLKINHATIKHNSTS